MMIPNLAHVLKFAEQSITKRVITVTSVDFEEVESVVDTTIQAVVQVADQETIQANNLDSSKRYLQVHTSDDLEIGDYVIYQQVEYKVVRESNYSDYGYRELIAEEQKA